MTPDDARILAEIKKLEERLVRLEKKVRGLPAEKAPPIPEDVKPAYRETLQASPIDPTLHDQYTDPPHIKATDKTKWNAVTQEVIQARVRKLVAKQYASLSQRLEAMETAINTQGIGIADDSGNSILNVSELEFVGLTLSGSTPNAIVTAKPDLEKHTHIWNEVPSGVIDGSNTNYALQTMPFVSNSVTVLLNGLEQRHGVDYTITGINLELVNPPYLGDILWVNYIVS